MKVLLLADPGSPHTIKWATSLASLDIDVCIFGLTGFDESIYRDVEKISVFSMNFSRSSARKGVASKMKYLTALPALKKIIRKFKPDILHAHYATSYGLLGALVGFHPYIVSVWGSDVFSFPRKSFMHEWLFKYNLRNADTILSTSHAMASETKKYTEKDVIVTPFGIDLDLFKPLSVKTFFNKNDIVIGTVKALEREYGIEHLIRAFAIVRRKHSQLPLKLLIVGGGSLEMQLKKLVGELHIDNDTIFTGKVPFSEVPKYHNMLSISVSVSERESFGVAVLEASACEKPVVVSRVGGLPEVVDDGVTGFIVPLRDPERTAGAIEKLILNEELRMSMGKSGRRFVQQNYQWGKSVKQMIDIYRSLLS